MEEHRAISQVLNCLEELTDRAVLEDVLDPEATEQALQFLRGFVDGCHRSKEEQHLFPLLERKGLFAHPIAAEVLAEHAEGRQLLEEMTRHLARAKAGNGQAVRHFAHVARRYVHLLRQHIYHEDHGILPLVERALSEQEDAMLVEAFQALEDRQPGAHQSELQLAGELADHLHVPRLVQGFGVAQQ
jgi:hemerythrin-like domain-containing protein